MPVQTPTFNSNAHGRGSRVAVGLVAELVVIVVIIAAEAASRAVVVADSSQFQRRPWVHFHQLVPMTAAVVRDLRLKSPEARRWLKMYPE